MNALRPNSPYHSQYPRMVYVPADEDELSRKVIELAKALSEKSDALAKCDFERRAWKGLFFAGATVVFLLSLAVDAGLLWKVR